MIDNFGYLSKDNIIEILLNSNYRDIKSFICINKSVKKLNLNYRQGFTKYFY